MIRFLRDAVGRRRNGELLASEAGQVRCRRVGTGVDVETCLACSFLGGAVPGSSTAPDVYCRFRPEWSVLSTPPV